VGILRLRTLQHGDWRRPTLRAQRLRWAWLLAFPFLVLSRPSPRGLLIGALISFAGLLLRAWAAGFIHKDQLLAVGGPYARLRHPLYVGSFLLGLGLAFAGGRVWIPVVFLCLFAWLYRRTILVEEAELARRFGKDYESYRGRVPPFFPRLLPHPTSPPSPPFQRWLYRRNKEWQAALGALLGYGLLWAKMCFPL